MDPHWPYLPKREEREDDNMDKIRQALESVPNDPLSYDFYYHILETDENGRVPDNKVFNQKSVSCLRRIADSDNKVQTCQIVDNDDILINELNYSKFKLN
jgi:hypothetical protein